MARVMQAASTGWSPDPGLSRLGRMLALAPRERVVVTSGPTADGWYSGHRLGDPEDAGWFSMYYVEDQEDEDATESDDEEQEMEDYASGSSSTELSDWSVT